VPLWAALCLSASASAGEAKELLLDPGFEIRQGEQLREWRPFEQGYVLSTDMRRSGRTAIRCENETSADRRGATAVLRLNQQRPQPVVVEGYSRAQKVEGFANNDYAIYLDILYQDGTPLWGQTAPFSTGTHDWERRRVLVFPAKPIREVYLHALFRHHVGTVWFDDFSARQLDPMSTFDAQAVAAPRLAANARHGWFVRDVAAGSPILPAAEGRNRLKLTLETRRGRSAEYRIVRVQDMAGKTRCVTVYYVERFRATGVSWWQDMRRRIAVQPAGEYANLTRLGAGATGTQSLYPLACVTTPSRGRAIGVPPEQGPVVVRLGYHAPSGLLYAAFDVALCPENKANSKHGKGFADLRVLSWDVQPEWGFRAALSEYYAKFPEAFRRRAMADGLWIPFVNPGTVQNHADFSFAYHEGDDSVASDDRLGILSFHYTEPMTWWMPMAPEIPRTYEAAVDQLRTHLRSSNSWERTNAQAVVHSGSHSSDGRFNVEFQNAPWTNGAVWVLNPNPRIPAPSGEFTKATLSFGPEAVRRRYGEGREGVLDGEYLDSLEGWAEVLDYRPESIRYSTLVPTFEPHGYRPVIPTWFSVYEFARFVRVELLRRGKLLMANATPWRIHAFAPLLDVMGTETNWLPGGRWRPDSDEVFCLRRALSYQKPYLLLQNTDFERFDRSCVERYLKRSMFYGVFPSMFSADAATRNYWTQPQWYNRDRDLFRRYVRVIAMLSKAGWEPVTGAKTSDARLYVERYGTDFLTVFNDSTERRTDTLTVLPSEIASNRILDGAEDVMRGKALPLIVEGGRQAAAGRRRVKIQVTLEAEDCCVIGLKWKTASERRSRP